MRAEVPMAEILTYGTALTSMTQGRGSFRMDMGHYDIVPQPPLPNPQSVHSPIWVRGPLSIQQPGNPPVRHR
jgi:translation elongation factor EF-G